jgi:hypothetical protein
VIQQNQETVKEWKQSNVVQSRSGDDRLKFGRVIVDSQSLKIPVSIVKLPVALDGKPGITVKKTRDACCSVTISPPPKPPDADQYSMEVVIQIVGESVMVPPPPKPPEIQTTPIKRYATRRGFLLIERVRFNLASIGNVLEKTGAIWVIGELFIFLNLMGQAQNKVSLLISPCVKKIDVTHGLLLSNPTRNQGKFNPNVQGSYTLLLSPPRATPLTLFERELTSFSLQVGIVCFAYLI